MATPTDDDNADDCISGNYYGYERGGTLAVEHRENIDQRSLGELFYVTIDELEDLRYMDALRLILSLLIDQVKELALFDEKKLSALLDKFIDELPILWSGCLKQCA